MFFLKFYQNFLLKTADYLSFCIFHENLLFFIHKIWKHKSKKNEERKTKKTLYSSPFEVEWSFGHVYSKLLSYIIVTILICDK